MTDDAATRRSLSHALREASVSSLEELVVRAAEIGSLGTDGGALPVAETVPAPDREAIGADALAPEVDVPLLLDGEVVEDRERLADLKGAPLHYTPLHNGPGVALAAFTRRDAMLAESGDLLASLGNVKLMSLDHVCTSDPNTLPEQVCFFQHVDEQGDVLCLQPGRAYQDLTRVGRAKLLWWYTADWNDTISSVSHCRWDVSLFEHVNFGGDEYFLRAGCNTPNLVPLGWNDRASGIVNWGPN